MVLFLCTLHKPISVNPGQTLSSGASELSFNCFHVSLNRPRGYKTFFVLNSVEQDILNAHK